MMNHGVWDSIDTPVAGHSNLLHRIGLLAVVTRLEQLETTDTALYTFYTNKQQYTPSMECMPWYTIKHTVHVGIINNAILYSYVVSFIYICSKCEKKSNCVRTVTKIAGKH